MNYVNSLFNQYYIQHIISLFRLLARNSNWNLQIKSSIWYSIFIGLSIRFHIIWRRCFILNGWSVTYLIKLRKFWTVFIPIRGCVRNLKIWVQSLIEILNVWTTLGWIVHKFLKNSVLLNKDQNKNSFDQWMQLPYIFSDSFLGRG